MTKRKVDRSGLISFVACMVGLIAFFAGFTIGHKITKANYEFLDQVLQDQKKTMILHTDIMVDHMDRLDDLLKVLKDQGRDFDKIILWGSDNQKTVIHLDPILQ